MKEGWEEDEGREGRGRRGGIEMMRRRERRWKRELA